MSDHSFGCNCGKKPKKSVVRRPGMEFTLTIGTRTQTFGSRLEAEAALVRSGGNGRITPSS